MPYQEDLCKEKHESIGRLISLNTARLDNHAKRIDLLEQEGREIKNEVKNLCKSIDGLVGTLKWSIGVLVTIAGVAIGMLKS